MGSNWSDRFGEVAEVVGVMGRPLQLCRGESLVHSILRFSSGLHATLHCHFNTITMHPLPFFHLSGDKVYTHHHAPPPLLPLIWRQGIHTSPCTSSPSSTYLETRYTHTTMHPLPFFHLSGDKVYTHHHAPPPLLPLIWRQGIHTPPCTPSPSSTYLETRYTHITMHPLPFFHLSGDKVYTHPMHPLPFFHLSGDKVYTPSCTPSPSSTYLETRYTHTTMHPLPFFHLSGDKVYTHHHAPPPLLPLIWRQGIHTSPCTPSPSSTYLETRYTHITMHPLPFFHLSGDKVYTHHHAPPPLLPLIWRQGAHHVSMFLSFLPQFF